MPITMKPLLTLCNMDQTIFLFYLCVAFRFKLDPLNKTHYMHSAYLLGLYQNNSFEADNEVGHHHGRYSSDSSALRGSSTSSSSESADSLNVVLMEMDLDSSNGPDARGSFDSHENQASQSQTLCLQPMPPLRNSLLNLELSQVINKRLHHTKSSTIASLTSPHYSRVTRPGHLSHVSDVMIACHLPPQVVFDSDYTLMMLGRISHLTSLKVEYRTWPLSLAQDDLSLLAPLTALRTLHLACCDAEGEGDPGLLALTSRSLAELCRCCKEMRSFHFSGMTDIHICMMVRACFLLESCTIIVCLLFFSMLRRAHCLE